MNVPTKTTPKAPTDPHARALVDELDKGARDVLVALFAAVQNGPEWTLHVITRELKESAHPSMVARTAAMRRAMQLDLVQRDGDVSTIGHALVELVAGERRGAKPVRSDSRSCFGVEWFTDELDAEAHGYRVREHRINGGFRNGERCGRDTAYDYFGHEVAGEPHAGRFYAVVVP